MSQQSYQRDFTRAYVGMKADSRYDEVLSLQAAEAIKFGLGVVKNIGADNKCRLPAFNKGVLVFDADFVADNDIDMNINGDAITTVEWDTNQATTLAALATEIQSHDDVLTAEVTALKTITVTGIDGTDILIDSIVVTNGISQANGTFTKGTLDVLEGISLATHAKEQARTTGIVEYAQTEAVSVLHKGAAYVYTEEAVSSDDVVYCRHEANGTGKEPGQFRNDSDSGKAFLVSSAKFKQTVSAAGPVQLEINLP